MEVPILGDVSWALLLACILMTGLYFYCTSHLGVWEKVGVPGPKPWPIINHLPDLRQGLPAALDKWQARYGRTFGTYGLISKSATLITTDVKLMNNILVKDFNNFTDRHNVFITKSSILKGLFFQQGSDWKRHRHVISPMFTGGRLRLMLDQTNQSAANLVTLIKKTKAKGGLIPLKKFAEKYSSDVIATTGFGVQSDALAEEDNEFSHHVEMFFTPPNTVKNIIRYLGVIFPFVMDIGVKLFSYVDSFSPDADQYFVALAKAALERKKAEKKTNKGSTAPRDMLDLLLMAEIEGNKQPDTDGKELTTEEIIANSTMLILAAFETTSRAALSTLYLLAAHPDVQEKVIEEIDRVLGGAKQPTYDQLSQLKYADQVISESIRLLPPLGVTREATETKVYDGVTIPKGTNVFMPVFRVLTDPEYFPDPEKFDPDRFGKEQSKDRDAILDMQFGFGPRLCIGKRKAIMEMKVLMCHLFSKMRFFLSDHTVPRKGEDMEMIDIGFGALLPKNPIELDVIFRE